jgi:hypothetical protein
MSKPDPTLAQISAQFTGYDVERSGGGYIILDRGTSDPIARLRPIPATDRFYERPLDNLWQHGAHETHARKRSRDRRERSDV